MANVTSSKVFKIKPENQVIADAEVIDCKFAGTTSVGFGPFAKTSYIYKVYIQIDGVEKIVVLKVKEKQGWNFYVVNTINAFGKAVDGKLPANPGDKLKVMYDRNKPKKCNILEQEV